MIIGDNFIWLHFPKCGGTITEKILRRHYKCDPSIRFDKIDPGNVIWHQNVRQRQKTVHENLLDKDIISNFRRLPSWIISRINYEEKRSGLITPPKMYVEGRFFERSGDISYADKTFNKFSEMPVKYWIRMEYLISDFFGAFTRYLDVQEKISPEEFDEKVNVNSQNKLISNYFSRDELEHLYASNPAWAAHERQLYGGLLI